MTTRAERTADATYALLVRHAEHGGWKGTRATRISIDDVRQAVHEVTRGKADEAQPEETLAACIDVLCGRGVLRPMHTTDRENIPLARRFHLAPITEAPVREVPDMPIWHRELYELADHWEAANPLRRARYTAINRWLKSGADRTPVPVRERCLDVFATFGAPECHPDAEKSLDARTTAALFGDEDRLMEVLRTFRVWPPLLSETVMEDMGGGGYRRVGTGDLLLVLENSTTWWSIVSALSTVVDHRVGFVAWGLGSCFTKSVESIAERHRITEVRYFGDLDLSGIRIPAQAASSARERGLPPVVPATRLYDALFTLGRPAPSRERLAVERVRQHLDWLGTDHRAAAIGLLAADQRLAQEWVGLRHLSTSQEWHDDLR